MSAFFVVLFHDLGKVVDLLDEILLRLSDFVHLVEMHAPGGCLHFGILFLLRIFLLLQLIVHFLSFFCKTVLSMLAVFLELFAHLTECCIESRCHLLELSVDSGLVIVDDLLEVGIMLHVLGIALVSQLDHAVHLCVHSSIFLSLLCCI